MWLSDVAVKRPVLATVANALLVVFGVFALMNITVREYPDIDPPIVSVSTTYPGASAAVVETRITQIIEDQIAGIEGVRSINSRSRDGRSDVNVEFTLSRDIEAAANDVRDRVSRAARNLPQEADPPIVAKSDSDASPILWMVLSSSRMTSVELSDYAERFLADRFGAIDGVSNIRIGGHRRQAMRVWLDRQSMSARGMTVTDVETALRTQNVEHPAGRLESTEREFTLRTARPFVSARDFEQLVITTGDDGYPVRLGDVARVEQAAADERSWFHADGQPTVGMGIVKQSSANTLSVARAVKEELERAVPMLPDGMTLRVNSDFSLFIEASLGEVIFTLLFAGSLVVLVIWLFLGSARATLIPALTVPISLTAAVIFLYAFGFSVNILTLLALVLAIGLVVDDTIVVVENIHRRMELGEPPLLAAFNGAREVGFAILATTLVLVAVFTPLAFLEGNVGRLFREFALSLSAAVVCSMFVALTLSSVLCSLLLKRDAESGRATRAISAALDRTGRGYRAALERTVDHPWMALGVLLLLVGGTTILFTAIPREFAPQEDRGQFFVTVTAPEGATIDYTSRYMRQIEDSLVQRLGQGEIDRIIVRVPSFGAADDVNTGIALVSLTDWRARRRTSTEVADELSQEYSQLPGVRAVAFERGAFGVGFGQPVQFVLGGNTYEELAEWRDRIIERVGVENPRLRGMDSNFKETKPQIDIAIDLNRAGALGVPVDTIGRALETMMGGRRVTTYIDRGQEYDVWLRAAAADRATPSDMQNLYVRSASSGALIPLSNLITTQESVTAPSFNRFDRLRAVTLSASLTPGYTLGEALDYVERVVAEEMPDARLSWAGQSREFKESSQALYLSFGMALLVVFLVLAAQFESFVHPTVIMTTVPLAVFGALAALLGHGMTLNIYSQIGIIMLIGLAAKNGILIVEFANQRRDAGLEFREALLEAAQIRLRPILMTSISTVMGVLPLYLGTGAGSEARNVLGVVVFWGVLFSALLTLFMVPAFYSLLSRHAGSPGRTAARLARQARSREDVAVSK